MYVKNTDTGTDVYKEDWVLYELSEHDSAIRGLAFDGRRTSESMGVRLWQGGKDDEDDSPY